MVKRKAPIPAGQDNNSSKHFDIENFDRVSTHKLFDNEAPIVPPHLIQIPFLIVKKSFYFLKFLKKEKKKKINKLWTKIPPHELEDPTGDFIKYI